MSVLIPALLVALSQAPAAAASDAPETQPPSAHELHTAQCVAALDARANELAKQVKAGKEAQRPLLRGVLEQGAAFIGSAYLGGERDEGRSRVLLDEAREAQKSLPPRELAGRQAACAEEGAALLAKSNVLSRVVVVRLADRQMNRLLGE